MAILSRKTIVGGVAAASLCAFLAVGASPASAAWHGGWGAPVAAGVLGGVALGALAAGAAQPYYGPAYGPPVVYAPPPPCWLQRQPIYNYDGNFIGYRRVRVCR